MEEKITIHVAKVLDLMNRRKRNQRDVPVILIHSSSRRV
jgi:hypothetical protein